MTFPGRVVKAACGSRKFNVVRSQLATTARPGKNKMDAYGYYVSGMSCAASPLAQPRIHCGRLLYHGDGASRTCIKRAEPARPKSRSK
ncbi:hypothetical protein VTN02DRAFT_4679 [Thermoascus thermophilus]